MTDVSLILAEVIIRFKWKLIISKVLSDWSVKTDLSGLIG